jgi:hypothetical protein
MTLSIIILYKYAQFHYAMCRVLVVVKLSVVLLNVVMLHAVAALDLTDTEVLKKLSISQRRLQVVRIGNV